MVWHATQKISTQKRVTPKRDAKRKDRLRRPALRSYIGDRTDVAIYVESGWETRIIEQKPPARDEKITAVSQVIIVP
jgi:hypothetical protein